MLLVRKLFIFCLILVLNSSTLVNAQSAPKSIQIAIGKAMKPYVLNQHHGIIIDLIKQSFLIQNQNVDFILLSNEKALRAFQNKSVDAIAVVQPNMVNAWLSDNFIAYKNHAISLKASQISIGSLSDLSKHRVTAFSHAHVYLGDNFNQAVSNNPRYVEVVNQFEQVKALFEGKTDIIISDQTIFKFHRKQLRHKYPSDSKYRQPINMVPLFAPSDYRIAFNNQELQQQFNEGYAELKSQGLVQKIYQKYTRLLSNY